MSQIWFERILRWRKKAQRFLQGRYARFDELNRTLLLTVYSSKTTPNAKGSCFSQATPDSERVSLF